MHERTSKAIRNSRYSQRMFDNHVKLGEPVWLSEKEEIIVTETIAEIVEKDKLNVVAYNICGDHAHILLICEEVELHKIVQKLKSMSARACNIAMGRTIPATPEHAPAHSPGTKPGTAEHAPLRGLTQFHLWTANAENKELQALAKQMCCTRQHAFRTEHTGGFDVIIGNPPYVRAELLADFREYLQSNFAVFHPAGDLFSYFYDKSFQLLKPKTNKQKLMYLGKKK